MVYLEIETLSLDTAIWRVIYRTVRPHGSSQMLLTSRHRVRYLTVNVMYATISRLLFMTFIIFQVVVQWNGVVVGILGFVDNWITEVNPGLTDEIEFLDIFSTAKSLSSDLRARGAEVSHDDGKHLFL